MKTIQLFILAFIGTIMTASTVFAQVPGNYKAPKIDASGKVTNAAGTHVGWVTKEGVIKDASGNKVAYIDSEGTLVEEKTGKKLGKASKNGNFLFEGTTTPDKGWTTSAAQNGACLVKDNKGNVVGEVHENYKDQGACAIHCLTKKTGK